ncbi:MAG TPA: zinc ribbon domain-containing protein [Kiritimatiellia bacterium]|nr:zinc ribbon domain-containing protein [Kiritimatiellia bacterium]
MPINPQHDFGTRECPSCATEVAANNNRCPICGYEFPAPSPRQRGFRLGGALLMLAILAFLILAGLW